MRGGLLRHVIDIQEPTITQDAAGQPSESWSTLYANVPAEVRQPPRGSEVQDGRVMTNVSSHQFRIRYLSGLDATMRIVWNSTNYNLVSVEDPTGLQWELLLNAKR